MKKSTQERPIRKKTTKAKNAEVAAEPEQFIAKAKFLWYSPYKLRPIVNVVRGKDVPAALQWLTTYRTQRAVPVLKLLESAVANAKSWKNIEPAQLVVKEIRCDGGPIHRYFKPGAQGRAQIQRKRMCHMKVLLQTKV